MLGGGYGTGEQIDHAAHTVSLTKLTRKHLRAG
jgi:hypothetical protein